MSHLDATDTLFFARPEARLDRDAAAQLTAAALDGMDDGELFLEYRESEALALEDGRIRSAAFDTTLGFGLRAVSGEAVGYAHAGEVSEAALRRAVETVRGAKRGRGGTMDVAPRSTNARLYSDANPVAAVEFAAKTALLAEIDAHARGRDPRVVQVMASLAGEWQAVQIIRADGTRAADIRPLVRLNVTVVVERNGRRETGSYGLGGRHGLDRLLDPPTWRAAADDGWRLRVTPYVSYVEDFIDARRCRSVNMMSCGLANQTATGRFVFLQYANADARLAGLDVSGSLPLVDDARLGALRLDALLGVEGPPASLEPERAGDDADGPGVGGGYSGFYTLAGPMTSDGLLWYTNDAPKEAPKALPAPQEQVKKPGEGQEADNSARS